MLEELLRQAARRMEAAYATLHAAHPAFDALPAHEQARLFADAVRGDPLAPVLFRMREGHGSRDAMRAYLRHPSQAETLLLAHRRFEGKDG